MANSLRLVIDVGPMPNVWCGDPAALSLAVQSGRDGLVHGVETEQGVRFEIEVGVKKARDGAPDFRGPLVHGRRGERFVYLSWGHVTADDEHVMFRRLKLYLSAVSRKGWSSPGIGWAAIERGDPVHVSVSGRGADGTPHCGSAPVRWA